MTELYDEHPFPSTTFAWRRVKIDPPPKATGHSASKASPSGRRATKRRSMQMREARELHLIGVKYRGGPSCFWELTYGAHVIRVDGGIALHDALRFLFKLDAL